MCILERWQTICNSNWSPQDAGVVCRQLGYSRYSESLSSVKPLPFYNHTPTPPHTTTPTQPHPHPDASANDTRLFGPGNGPIYATDVLCTSEEGRIVDCVSNTDDVSSCSHANDVGVTCIRDCTLCDMHHREHVT